MNRLLVVTLLAASGVHDPPAMSIGSPDGVARATVDRIQAESRLHEAHPSPSVLWGEVAAYDLDAPERSLELAKSLREISGLTVLPDDRLGAVQDEAGTLYVLDSATGAVGGRAEFGRKGDYEGLEVARDEIFVLRSDGILFELAGWGGTRLTVRGHQTGLDAENDPEGLAFDRVNNRLLIACKEKPGAGLDDGVKAVYAFDLTARKLVEDPVLLLDLDEIEDMVERKDVGFKPSGLAVHPQNGDVYVLSAKPRALAVVSAEGRLKAVSMLSGKLFEQPEGLAFGADGTLYISSEGVDRPGMIHRFARK